MDAVEHVAATPGTPAEHTKQFPVLAFRADAQRSAKQPAQSRMTSLTTPLTTRDVASQGPASAPRSHRMCAHLLYVSAVLWFVSDHVATAELA